MSLFDKNKDVTHVNSPKQVSRQSMQLVTSRRMRSFTNQNGK